MPETTAGYRSPSAHYAPAWRCFVFEEGQARTPTVSGMPPTRARPMRQWLGITQNGSDWRMLLGPLRLSLFSFLNETQRGERIARRSRAVANRGRRACAQALPIRAIFAGRLTCEFCELRFHTPISLLTPYNSAVASCCVWIHPGAWERSRGRALQYAPHSAIVPDM